MNIKAILAGIGSLAVTAAPLTGGGLANVLLLGKLLQPGTDWKRELETQGEAFVRRTVQDLWTKHLGTRVGTIASSMANEGWTFESAMQAFFQKAQRIDPAAVVKAQQLGGRVGAAWLISRDALYSCLRETSIPGGQVRDAWRDAADDKVFSMIQPEFTPSSTLEQVVAATAAALPPLTL